MTLAQLIRNSGAKVTKEFKGYYIYHGVNFTVKFNEDSCESTWWEVNMWDEKHPLHAAIIEDELDQFNSFERKADVLGYLFNIDQAITNKTED